MANTRQGIQNPFIRDLFSPNGPLVNAGITEAGVEFINNLDTNINNYMDYGSQSGAFMDEITKLKTNQNNLYFTNQNVLAAGINVDHFYNLMKYDFKVAELKTEGYTELSNFLSEHRQFIFTGPSIFTATDNYFSQIKQSQDRETIKNEIGKFLVTSVSNNDADKILTGINRVKGIKEKKVHDEKYLTTLAKINNPVIRELFTIGAWSAFTVGEKTVTALNNRENEFKDNITDDNLFTYDEILENTNKLITNALDNNDLGIPDSMKDSFPTTLTNYLILGSRTKFLIENDYLTIGKYIFENLKDNITITKLNSNDTLEKLDDKIFNIAFAENDDELKIALDTLFPLKNINRESNEFKAISQEITAKGIKLEEKNIIPDITFTDLERKLVTACKAYSHNSGGNEAYATTALALAGLLNEIASIDQTNADQVNNINRKYENENFAGEFKRNEISVVSITTESESTSKVIQPLAVLKLRAESLLSNISEASGYYEAEHNHGNTTALNNQNSLGIVAGQLASVIDGNRETLKANLETSLGAYNNLKLTQEHKDITRRIGLLNQNIHTNLNTNLDNADAVRQLRTQLTASRNTWMTNEQITGFEDSFTNLLTAEREIREGREAEAEIERGHDALDTEIAAETKYYYQLEAFNNPEITRKLTALRSLADEPHVIDQENLTRRRSLLTPLKATAAEKALNLRTIMLERKILDSHNAILPTDLAQAATKTELENLRQEVVRSWTLATDALRTDKINNIETRYNTLLTAPVGPMVDPDAVDTVDTPNPSLITNKRLSRKDAKEFAESVEVISQYMNDKDFESFMRSTKSRWNAHYNGVSEILKKNEMKSPLLNMMNDFDRAVIDPLDVDASFDLKKKKYKVLAKELNRLHESTNKFLNKVDSNNTIENIISKEVNFLIERAETIVARPAHSHADKETKKKNKDEHVALCLEAITQISLIEGKLAKKRMSDDDFNKIKKSLDGQIKRLYDETDVLNDIHERNLVRTHSGDETQESYSLTIAGDTTAQQIQHLKTQIRGYVRPVGRDDVPEGTTLIFAEDITKTSSTYSMSVNNLPTEVRVDPKIRLKITERANVDAYKIENPTITIPATQTTIPFDVQFVSGTFGGKPGLVLLDDANAIKHLGLDNLADLDNLLFLAAKAVRIYDTQYGDMPGKQMTIGKGAPPMLQAVIAVYCEACYSQRTGDPYPAPKTTNATKLSDQDIEFIKKRLETEPDLKEKITGKRDGELTIAEKQKREEPAPEKNVIRKYFDF